MNQSTDQHITLTEAEARAAVDRLDYAAGVFRAFAAKYQTADPDHRRADIAAFRAEADAFDAAAEPIRRAANGCG